MQIKELHLVQIHTGEYSTTIPHNLTNSIKGGTNLADYRIYTTQIEAQADSDHIKTIHKILAYLKHQPQATLDTLLDHIKHLK